MPLRIKLATPACEAATSNARPLQVVLSQIHASMGGGVGGEGLGSGSGSGGGSGSGSGAGTGSGGYGSTIAIPIAVSSGVTVQPRSSSRFDFLEQPLMLRSLAPE
jgi:hypothetical protein